MNKDPYAWCAKRYDNFLESTTNRVKLRADDFFVAEPGMNILDIGCGTGSLLKLYREDGCKVTGIDSSPSMLKICESKLDGLGEIHLGNASNLPFSDESFDLVLSILTIHEMSPVVRFSVMKEAKRVLKKSGRYIIYEYNVGEIKFPQIIFKRAESLFFEILAGREHFKNYREYMAKGLQPYIKECGFIIEKEKIVDPGENTLIMLKKE